MQPLIIEAAINGFTSKQRNPQVPRSVSEVVESALACLEAGAAMIHNHTDDGLPDGRHASAPYREAWTAIYQKRPDAVLYPTMGSGGTHTNIKERYAHFEELADAGLLRMTVIDPGSVSLGPVDEQGLPKPVEVVYQNTFADVRYMVGVCRKRGLGAHISIFEPGFLRVALAYHRAGQLPPAKIQLYFGGPELPFGLPPSEMGLRTYLSMLEGSRLPWMVGVIGGDVRESLAELAIRLGGHVRIGLEDYAGPDQPRNEALVRDVVAMAKRAGRPIATSVEAAAIIRLPARTG